MKKTIAFVMASILLLTVAISVTASSGFDMTYYSGTNDTVNDLPGKDSGTGGEAYTVSSQIPQREGYEFIEWVLNYGGTYKVTYVVNPDPIWKEPKDATVPTDPKEYISGEMVDVLPQLTTTVDYAFNENEEKVKGTWEFVTWDKDDFPIYEDTTITGGWRFTAAPAKKFKYTVKYMFWDGKELTDEEVALQSSDTVDALGEMVNIEIIPAGDKRLKPKYRTKVVPMYSGNVYSVTIYKEDQVIIIPYRKKATGQ